jgi:hypothetical protein
MKSDEAEKPDHSLGAKTSGNIRHQRLVIAT